MTYGGLSVAELNALGTADATIVVGRSLNAAADLLHERTGVPDYRFDHLLGLEASDALVYALAAISGRDVPAPSSGNAPSFRTPWSTPTSRSASGGTPLRPIQI